MLNTHFIYNFRGKQHKSLSKIPFLFKGFEFTLPLSSKPIPVRDLTEVCGRVKMYFKKIQGVFMQEL